MNVESQLEAVTVYSSGAICTRQAKARLSEPRRQLSVGGLPLSLKPGSLRARVTAGVGRVLDVRAGFDVKVAEEIDVPAEQKALEDAQRKVLLLEAKAARLSQELKELAALRPVFLEPRRGEPPREPPVDALLAFAAFTDAELKKRHDQKRALDEELRDAQADVTLHQRRLQEASSARRTERAQLSRSAVITFAEAVHGELSLAIEYQVPGAQWTPNYELRLEPSLAAGRLTMRASVAQSTGEDWLGVRLSLSTADLDRRTDLPELRALKIGRSQPAPPPSGWRDPPPGLDELFAGYLGAASGEENRPKLPPPPPPPAPPPAMPVSALKTAAMPQRAPMPMAPPRAEMAKMARASESMDDDMNEPAALAAPATSRARSGFSGGLGGGGAPGAGARAKKSAPAPSGAALLREMADGGYPEGAPMDEAWDGEGGELGDSSISPEDQLLDYDALVMPGPQEPHGRGRLRPAGEWEVSWLTSLQVEVNIVSSLLVRAQSFSQQAAHLGLPNQCVRVRDDAGHYDYRYDAATVVDVPSAAKWSLVPVMTAEVALKPGYISVPAVDPKVYRVLSVNNLSAHALLRGPVDVSVGESFLITTVLPKLAPRGEAVELGLGVEEAIKVARKTQYRETTGGLLGGSTVLPHEIEIEVANGLAQPVRVELRERVPVSNDSDIKVEEQSVKPPWEKDEALRNGVQVDGGRRWLLQVDGNGKATVVAQFAIRIPNDKMLVGGNRRV